MRQHAAFDPTAAYRRPVGVKGSLRRAAPALDPAQAPNTSHRYPLEIQERLNFYNTERPHSSLDKKTPDEFYFATLPAIKQAA